MTASEPILEHDIRSSVSRSCPVCRANRSTLLCHQSFEQLSGVGLLSGYDVVICRECGGAFSDGIPEQEVFDRYYRDLSKYEQPDYRPAGTAAVEPRFQAVADTIAPFIPTPDTRVLEIGCASGGLLKALQERGCRNLFASDPSPACIRAAQELYGIPGAAGTVFSIPRTELPYEFLVLTGVMEHIRDLESTVARFHDLLAERGRVYLEVPDASRYDWQLDAPFQEFSLEHINYFSRTSLANLMRTRGFRVLATGRVMRPLHEITCPGTFGVFQRTGENQPLVFDTETEPGLRRYIEGCGAEDERIHTAIRRSLAPGQRMIVWGVGAHTLRLLAAGGLDPSRIALFVDSSCKYQNRELLGIRVASPAELEHWDDPILISSRGFQREIHHQIRNVMGLRNPLILLYGVPTEAHRHGA